MKSPITLIIAIIVLALAAGPYIYFESIADDADSAASEFARLEDAGNDDPQEWLQLARDAREQNDLDIATRSLDKAAELGLSPLQFGIDKARNLVAAGDHAAAIEALRGVHAAGFNGVGVLTNDPLISTRDQVMSAFPPFR